MAVETKEARIRQKTATLPEWMSNALTILDGEQAFVRTTDGTPINFRIGDGLKAFKDLPDWIRYDQSAFVRVTDPVAGRKVGSYTVVGGGNYSGTVVADGKLAVLYWTGTSWSINYMADLPKGADGKDAVVSNEGGDSTTTAISQKYATDTHNEIFKSPLTITPNIIEGNYYGTTNGNLTPGTWATCTDKINISGNNSVDIRDTSNNPITGVRAVFWNSDGSFNSSPPVTTSSVIQIPSGGVFLALNMAVGAQGSYTVYTIAQIRNFRLRTAIGGSSIEKLSDDVNALSSKVLANTNDIVVLNDKTDIIVSKSSINLADKSKIMPNMTVGYGNANISASQDRKLLIVHLPKRNTIYSLVGFNNNYVGRGYNNNVNPNVLSTFNESTTTGTLSDTAEPNKTQWEINSGDNTYYVALVLTRTNAPIEDTVMLYEGRLSNIPPYEPYGNIKGVSWDNILDKPNLSQGLPLGFYQYLSTGGETSTGRFIVYQNIGSNRYIGLNLDHVVNQNIRADLWRIRDSYIYSLIDGTMSNTGIKAMHSSENEYVFAVSGEPDSTGGYHGDEKLTSIDFLVDGVKINTPIANIPLTACSTFTYNQISNTFLPSSVAETNIATHRKSTSFLHGGYKTYNRLDFVTTLNVTSSYGGLCCISPEVGRFAFSKQLNIVRGDTTLPEKDILLESGINDRVGEINYYNVDNSVSAKCESEWLLVIKGGQDVTTEYWKLAQIRLWDRVTDLKYYHRNIRSNIFNDGDSIQSVMTVSFKY